MSSVIAVRAADICNKIPGLTSSQRALCQSRPDVFVAIGEGARLAVSECQRQFRHHRWNCTAIGSKTVFGHVIVVGSREAAFVYSIFSAGVTYMITQSCSRGNVSDCGCDRRKGGGAPAPAGWKWGGCSVDVRYGIRLARKFIDARELEGDARSLMNLHNNQAGREAQLEDRMQVPRGFRFLYHEDLLEDSSTIRPNWRLSNEILSTVQVRATTLGQASPLCVTSVSKDEKI